MHCLDDVAYLLKTRLHHDWRRGRVRSGHLTNLDDDLLARFGAFHARHRLALDVRGRELSGETLGLLLDELRIARVQRECLVSLSYSSLLGAGVGRVTERLVGL